MYTICLQCVTLCIHIQYWLDLRVGLIDKGDAIDDNYLNGLKTLNEPVKIVDPEWNDWLAENQHLFKPMGLRKIHT